MMINAMRKLEIGLEYDLKKHHLGIPLIQNAIEQMKYIQCKDKNLLQALDNNLHWVKAQLNFNTQVLVQLRRAFLECFIKHKLSQLT